MTQTTKQFERQQRIYSIIAYSCMGLAMLKLLSIVLYFII